MDRFRRCSGALLLFASLGAPDAQAYRFDVGFGTAAEYSDNIGLVSGGQREDAWVGTASARGRMVEHSANLDAEVEARAEHRDYQTDLFSDETLFGLDASLRWLPAPGRFSWSLEDYFRQASVDVFAAPTPANRQDTNVLSTGPEFRARFSPVHSAVLGARYGNFYFENSDADSHRYAGYARWIYLFSPRTTVSLNGEFADVDFMNEAFPDYGRSDGFVRVGHHYSRARVEVDAGRSLIRRTGEADIAGFLGRAGWHVEFNSASGLDVTVMHRYTDVGSTILETAGRNGAVGALDEQVTGDVFYSRHTEVAYRGRGLRASWRLAVAHRDENFETVVRDREFDEGFIDLGYELTSTVTGALAGIYRRAESLETGQVNTDRRGGLRLSYRANSRLTGSVEVAKVRRESNVSGGGFEENRALIGLVYQRTPFVE